MSRRNALFIGSFVGMFVGLLIGLLVGLCVGCSSHSSVGRSRIDFAVLLHLLDGKNNVALDDSIRINEAFRSNINFPTTTYARLHSLSRSLF